ncbi:MAG: hypothetical protein ABSB40_10660 [Nitrososphaeria archaeon]|jgi:hypothetical protein
MADIYSIFAGALLGLASSLVGIIFYHLLSEEEENERRLLRDWQDTVDKVYSPIAFTLYEIRDNFVIRFHDLDISKPPTEVEKENCLLLLNHIKEGMQYTEKLADILRSGLYIIKPFTLRIDLLQLYSYIEMLKSDMLVIPLYSSLAGNIKNISELAKELDEFDIALLESVMQIGKMLEKPINDIYSQVTFLGTLRERKPAKLLYNKVFNDELVSDINKIARKSFNPSLDN